MSAILVATGFVRIDSDTKPALKALKSLGAIGANALTTTLIPAVAAVTTGVLAMGAAAASAGAALGAFGAAVKPQFKDIADASAQYETAQKAQQKAEVASAQAHKIASKFGIKYGETLKITKDMSAATRKEAEQYNKSLAKAKSSTEAAKNAQDLYKDSLANMTPATRETALAFNKLKDDFKKWSDGLSGTTMPIFTKGINMLREALPKLTPFVRIAATQIKNFMDTLGEGQAGRVFKEFGTNMRLHAGGALKNFLGFTKNMIVGIVGVLNAFAPFQTKVTGGLATMGQKFADFGANLGKSKGFATFIKTAQDGAPKLGAALKALADAFVKILASSGPLAGASIKIAEAFAAMVKATPVPVLKALIPIIVAVNLGMKLYAIYTVAATAATWLFAPSLHIVGTTAMTSRASLALYRLTTIATTAATYVMTAATRALAVTMAFVTSPIGIVVLAVAALAIGFVIAYKKSETFRNGVKIALHGVMVAGQEVGKFFSGPFVRFFTEMIPHAFQVTKDWVKANWPWFAGALAGPIGIGAVAIIKHWRGVRDFFTDAWGVIKRNVVDPIGRFFTKTLPSAAETAKRGILTPIRIMVIGVLNGFGSIIHGAAKIFGWVPGVGGKLKSAEKAFNKFKDNVNKALGGISNRKPHVAVDFSAKIKTLPVATGGAIHGPGTETSDSIPARLSRGEHVWSAREVRGAGGHGVMSAMRKQARQGTVGFASGGAVDVEARTPSAASINSQVYKTTTDLINRNALKLFHTVYDAIINVGPSGGSGVKRWTNVVQMALQMLRQPMSYTAMTLRRMNQESGGNPNIVNRWDSNWQAGHPSVGLMQVIRGTFQRYAGKYLHTGPFLYGVSVNPMANVYSSMRYALGAYGSIPRAYNRAGGYANGTAGTSAGWHLFGEHGPEMGYSPAGWRIRNARQTVSDHERAIVIQRLVIENHGVIGSQHEVENWLVNTLDQLRRHNRIKAV